MSSSSSLWCAVASGLLLGADGFGKYLSHRQKQRDEDEDGDFMAKTLASKIKDIDAEDESKDGSDGSDANSELDFEVAAGLLILALFLFFGCVYVCLLQFWWRCADRRRRKRLEEEEATAEAEAGKNMDRCSGCAETPWEPVDLDKCIRESSNLNDDCLSAITATTDEEEPTS